ncbi:hypothetical protein AUJ78_01810 [Candidatus Peregrinibacteria bacterium CG1_02_41_10]|nr:MAG: hypothetical protein AUJ78_01810 [Candidatus Peregrinibacteria bacterium CG1_02_41_10]
MFPLWPSQHFFLSFLAYQEGFTCGKARFIFRFTFFSSRNFSIGFNAAKEKLEIVSGAAPQPFRIFAGGLFRKNAFGLIQEYCTMENITLLIP